jgi:NitT/TauT family transport system substrate-binding protein
MIPEDGPPTALRALAAYNVDIRNAKIDLAKTWTNDFTRRANEKYPEVKV